MDIRETLVTAIAEALGKDAAEITDDTNITADFAATSVDFVHITKALEKAFDMTVPFMKFRRNKTIADMVSDATVAIGEKISIRRFERYETAGVVSTYIHLGGKVGVLVEVAADEASRANDGVKTFAHDLALQIAAARPEAVRREEVDVEKLNKEKEILRAQALNEGKPEKIVERMVEGRIEKYYKEVCLLEQPYVKDADKTIKGLMGEVAKAAGATCLDVVKFVRFERGEGIEKRKDDLAAEIAAMQKA